MRGENEAVRARVAPVDDANALFRHRAIGVAIFDVDPVAQEFQDFAIGGERDHGGAVARERIEREVERVLRQAEIEPREREPQRFGQKSFAPTFAPRRAVGGEGLAEEIEMGPAEGLEKFDCRALDERVFREPREARPRRARSAIGEVRRAGVIGYSAASAKAASARPTSISPEISLGSRRSRAARRRVFWCDSVRHC